MIVHAWFIVIVTWISFDFCVSRPRGTPRIEVIAAQQPLLFGALDLLGADHDGDRIVRSAVF